MAITIYLAIHATVIAYSKLFKRVGTACRQKISP